MKDGGYHPSGEHNTLELDRELGCPFHTDTKWARLLAADPAGWADAVAFDKLIRHGPARANADGHPLRGQFFLHRQRIPLDQVRLRPQPVDNADTPGCGPWTCPHTGEQAPVAIESDGAGLPVREMA
jgi:hypothetical protein